MEKKYVSVSGLNKYLKTKIDQDMQLQKIYIKGEISNFKRHSSGHLYFTLKDSNSRINAVMFSSKAKLIDFDIKDGAKVLIGASLSVYEVAGTYQLYVNTIEQDGIGSLFLQFEKRKQELHKEGLFDEVHKKKIPKFPQKIAVLTANPSAALMDILKTIKHRFPVVRVYIFPIPVQGKGAYLEIEKTLKYVDTLNFSTIILGRGGGSIEDLWNFNEESLARTIYSCNTPIISGVGHEVDFTIADFVSDMRAPTPTGAALLATPDIVELKQNILYKQQQLQSVFTSKLKLCKSNVKQLQTFYLFENPQKLFEGKKVYIDSKIQELEKHITKNIQYKKDEFQALNINIQNQKIHFINDHKNALSVLKAKLDNSVLKHVTLKKQNFVLQVAKLDALSPLQVLNRGYTIVKKDNHPIVKKVMLKTNDEISIEFKDGSIEAVIK